MRWTLGLALALGAVTACKPKDDSGGDTSDTDTADTGDSAQPEGFKGYAVRPDDVATSGVPLISLVRVTFESGVPVPHETLTHIELSGTGVFNIELPEVAPAEQVQALDAIESGLLGATYAPVVFQDDDADGVFTEGEVVVGIGVDRWLAWLDGTLPTGFTPGWQQFDPDLQGNTGFGTWTPYTLVESEAEIRLYGLDAAARMHGNWKGADTEMRLMGLDWHAVTDGAPADTPAFDATIDDEHHFDTTVEKRPPQAHHYVEENGIRWAKAIPTFYVDSDHDGKYTPTDERLPYTLCYDGAPFQVRWVESPTTLSLAITMDTVQYTTGWRGVQDTEAGEVELTGGQMLWLEPDEDCTFSSG